MANDDIIKKVKDDNVLLQRYNCGGCQRSLAMVSDFDAAPVKGKKNSFTNSQAMGAFCTDCQKDKMKSEEGPRTAMYIDPRDGEVRIAYYDSLVDLPTEATSATETETETEG